MIHIYIYILYCNDIFFYYISHLFDALTIAEQRFDIVLSVQLGLCQPAWPKVVAVHFLQLLQLNTLVYLV